MLKANVLTPVFWYLYIPTDTSSVHVLLSSHRLPGRKETKENGELHEKVCRPINRRLGRGRLGCVCSAELMCGDVVVSFVSFRLVVSPHYSIKLLPRKEKESVERAAKHVAL